MDGTPKSTKSESSATAWGPRVASILEFVAKTAAVCVPIFYALGRIYSDSYWKELRLPSSLMEYAAEDYLYFGFISIANGVARLVGLDSYTKAGYAVLFAATVGIIVVVAGLLQRLLRTRTKALGDWARKRVDAAKASKHWPTAKYGVVFMIVTSFLVYAVFAISSALLLLLLPISLASESGKEAGMATREQQQIQIYHHGVPPPPRTIARYRDRDALLSSPLIECSPSWCVVYTDEKFTAIKADDMVKIDQEPEPKMATSRSSNRQPNLQK